MKSKSIVQKVMREKYSRKSENLCVLANKTVIDTLEEAGALSQWETESHCLIMRNRTVGGLPVYDAEISGFEVVTIQNANAYFARRAERLKEHFLKSNTD